MKERMRLKLEKLVLKDETRRKLRSRVNTCRPFKWAEIGSLAFFGWFFVYTGLRHAGWLEWSVVPKWVNQDDWQFSICIAAAIFHLGSLGASYVVRRKLKPEVDRLLDYLDEIQGGWSVDGSGRLDSQLVKDTMFYMEPTLFRGRYAMLWSAGLALTFIVVAFIGRFSF